MGFPEHTRMERGERYFQWMERQAPECRIGQSFVQMMRWLAENPASGRSDLEARLRSKGVEQFEGAFLELYLHRLLRRTIPGVEATITACTTGASRPDLQLVRAGDAVKMEITAFRHLEADRALDLDGMDILREATRFVTTPGFMLWIESFERGTAEPKKARLGNLIDKMLQNQSHQKLLAQSARPGQKNDLEKLPVFTIKDELSGWSWAVRPVPLPDPQQRPESLAANSGNTTVYHGRVPDRLRDAIEGKLEQHRNEQGPLIIAACCNAWPGEPDDEACCSVLLGTEYWTFPRDGAGSPSGSHRHRDGLFTRSRPNRERPLALLTTSRCFPWEVPHAHFTLWDNPHAQASGVLVEWPFRRVSWNLPSGDAAILEGRPPADDDLR